MLSLYRRHTNSYINSTHNVHSECYSDTVFVFGHPSSSRGPVAWFKLRSFIISLIHNMKIGEKKTRVAMLMYSENSEVLFAFANYTAMYQITEAIYKIKFKPVRSVYYIITLLHFNFTSFNF